MVKVSLAWRTLVLILALSTLQYPVAIANGELNCVYLVKKGDTLSQIAQSFVGEPVYPKASGSLDRLLQMNPNIHNKALIEIGMPVVLDHSGLSENACMALQQKAGTRKVASDSSGATPSSEAVSATANKRFGILELNAFSFYTKIDGVQTSNGTSARLLSKLNKGLEFFWRQVWNDSFRTFVNFGVTAMVMDDPLTRTLDNKEFTTTQFGLGSQYFLTDGLKVGAWVGTREEIFYHATTATALRMDTLVIPQLELNASLRVFDLNPFGMGVGGSYRYLTKASNDLFSVESGSTYRGNIYLDQTISRNATLKAGIFYSVTEQNSSLITQKRSDVGMDFGLEWSLKP